MVRIGSLFSGIGGLELGLEQGLADLGIPARTIWQVEMDDYATAILARHWPDARRFRDVREVGAGELGPVDLICGGFPCQDISVGGSRLELAGAKSGLWFEFARIVGEIRPSLVVVENVTTIAAPGRWLGRVLGELAALGYDAEWHCLQAADVGAVHPRDRVFIIAHARGGRYGPSEKAVFARRPIPKLHAGWAGEPDVGRVVHGIPDGVDRRRLLGNAVCPPVARVIGQWIGYAMLEASDA